MVAVTLVVDACVGFGLAALYASLARIMRARRLHDAQAATANQAFAAWWLALGAFMVLSATRSLLGGLGVLDRGIHAALYFLSFPPLFLAVASLLQYLVYLHTGTLRHHRTILYAHVALAVAVFTLVVWRHPLAVVPQPWSVPFVFEREAPRAVGATALLAILGPVITASGAYFALAFRTRDPLARFRILTVSGALALWFGTALFGNLAGFAGEPWWPLVARGAALLAGLVVLFAYRPPRALERRLEALRAQVALEGGAR